VNEIQLTAIEGAESRYDENGNEIVDIATCGTCGRSWNDAAISSVTPAPSARCPFEYEHEADEEEDRDLIIRHNLDVIERSLKTIRLALGRGHRD